MKIESVFERLFGAGWASWRGGRPRSVDEMAGSNEPSLPGHMASGLAKLVKPVCARIVHWSNSGAAFGSFQNGNAVFSVLAVLVILAIFYYFPRVEANDWTLRLAMGLQMGGAAGNLVDRLLLQRVTDFISIGNFPVFNIADSSISIGVAVLLLGVWIKERAEKKSPANTTDSGS